mmetsp:Transcript_88960/g.194922  ORF Transcript_88960/g.194922 Transcript_88960/m.194922 type:complete len:766 (-) Transcript_88960:34-2331(-)
MGGCAVTCFDSLLGCCRSSQHFAADDRVKGGKRRRRRNGVGQQVQRELRHSATPQRVEGLLRLFEVRGAFKAITDFYEPLDEIGSGFYGSVHKMMSKHTIPTENPEIVAVKFVKWARVWHGFWRDPEQEELVRRELKMLMVLDNPFIIRVREWFEDNRGVYFVQEMCDGGSLQDLLDQLCEEPSKEVRMESYERLRSTFRQITYALQYLHQMDPPVTHCDLKPENALFKTKEPTSSIKLIDFGLVSLHEADETLEHKWVKGTQIFMAPEQFLQAQGTFTTHMDVWALGVIFCWMITALDFGQLLHPALDEDEGVGFQPHFMTLHSAYRDWERDALDGGDMTWRRELFRHQSEIATDLGDRMLVLEAEGRWTTREIMHHAWTMEGDTASTDLLSQESVVMNLRMYSKLNRFERTLLHIVAGRVSAQVGEKREIVRDLQRTFLSLDVDGTGRLRKRDLLDGLRKTWGSRKSEEELALVEKEIDALFEELGTTGCTGGSGSPEASFGLDALDEAEDEENHSSFDSPSRSHSQIGSRSHSRSICQSPASRPPDSGGGWASPSKWATRTCSDLIGGSPTSGKSDLTYTEFLAATIGSQILSTEEYLMAAFHELDASQTGSLTWSDLEGTIGIEDTRRVFDEVGKEMMTYADFKWLAQRVARKRWGIVPKQTKTKGKNLRDIVDRVGIRPMKTLSGSSVKKITNSLKRRLSLVSSTTSGSRPSSMEAPGTPPAMRATQSEVIDLGAARLSITEVDPESSNSRGHARTWQRG